MRGGFLLMRRDRAKCSAYLLHRRSTVTPRRLAIKTTCQHLRESASTNDLETRMKTGLLHHREHRQAIRIYRIRYIRLQWMYATYGHQAKYGSIVNTRRTNGTVPTVRRTVGHAGCQHVDHPHKIQG